MTQQHLPHLIERLRGHARFYEQYHNPTSGSFTEAADTIEALKTRVTEVEAERDRLYTLAKANNDLARMNGARAQAAEQQLSVMREALEPFARAAGTDTVEHAARDGLRLTVSDGRKMFMIAPEAFTGAARALSATNQQEKVRD